jgi:hypothetical protein
MASAGGPAHHKEGLVSQRGSRWELGPVDAASSRSWRRALEATEGYQRESDVPVLFLWVPPLSPTPKRESKTEFSCVRPSVNPARRGYSVAGA